MLRKYHIPTSSILLFALSVAWLGLHHFGGFFGHYGYDDMHYARLANSIVTGDFHLTGDHYTYRWGVVFPIALSYSLFGISDFSSAVWPMLLYLLGVGLLLNMLKSKHWTIQSLCILFYICQAEALFYVDKIMPDYIIQFCFLASFYCIYKLYFQDGWRSLAYVLPSILCLGLMTKLSIYFIIPWLAFSFVWRYSHAKFKLEWGAIISMGIALLILYFSLIYALTGNVFARFTAIQDSPYISDCSYDILERIHLYKRIAYEFWALIWQTSLFIPLSISIAAVCIKNKKSRTSSTRFVLYSFGVFLLTSNFLSTSFGSYTPLCLDMRHYLFLAFSGALVVSHFGKEYVNNQRLRIASILVVIVLSLACIALGYALKLWPYLMFVSASLLLGLIKDERLKSYVFMLALFSSVVYWPIKSYTYANESHYKERKELIQKSFQFNPDKNTIIITNKVSANTGEYQLGFPKEGLVFKTYAEVDSNLLMSADHVYVYREGMTRYLAGLSYKNLPFYAKEIPVGSIVKHQGSGGELLYIPDPTILFSEK